MQKYTAVAILAITIALVGFGCTRGSDRSNGAASFSPEKILAEAKKNGLIMDDAETLAMSDVSHLASVSGSNPEDQDPYVVVDKTDWKAAALADVTGGGSFGLAFSDYRDGNYTLVATMGNLPPLAEEQFYEGWIVKRGKQMSVVSIGKVEPRGDKFAHVFVSKEDLRGYDFFVVTSESDDGHLAPDQHKLEGTFK